MAFNNRSLVKGIWIIAAATFFGLQLRR